MGWNALRALKRPLPSRCSSAACRFSECDDDLDTCEAAGSCTWDAGDSTCAVTDQDTACNAASDEAACGSAGATVDDCVWSLPSLQDLQAMCDTYPECVSVDVDSFDNLRALRFSSAAALNAIAAPPGWQKWNDDTCGSDSSCVCQSDCRPIAAGNGEVGECWVRTPVASRGPVAHAHRAAVAAECGAASYPPASIPPLSLIVSMSFLDHRTSIF